jgi:hypothetical protein
VEALQAHFQKVREVGDVAFVEGLRQYFLAVGAAIERGDMREAQDLVAALILTLAKAP